MVNVVDQKYLFKFTLNADSAWNYFVRAKLSDV